MRIPQIHKKDRNTNMYNTCYTGTMARTGCGNYGGWNLFTNGCGTQRICRDCCGNLHVQNVETCTCFTPWNRCLLGNGTNTAGNGGTGNATQGGFRCVTFCGVNPTQQATQTTTQGTTGVDCGEAYYARQYGFGCGRCNRCGYNWYE